MIRHVMMSWLMMTLFSTVASAQTWDEWFRQQKTQKAYLIKQVAALKIYADVLREGYGVVKTGLNIIGDLRDGEFSLHRDYFSSLKAVSDAVKGSPIIAKCFQLDVRTTQVLEKARKTLTSKRLTNNEARLLETVLDGIQREQSAARSRMKMAIEDGLYEMSDEERITVLNQTYKELTTQHEFAISVYEETRLLIRQREVTEQEIRYTKSTMQ